METIKFITFTDVHVSVVNPSSRRGSYEDDIFEKLNQIKKVGEKYKVDFFVFAGDLFNLKYPMRNPHELNSKLIQLFKSFPAPIYATEGNHDLRSDSYETFSEQPLNVIYSSEALIQTRDEHLDIRGVRVRLRGFPFREEPDLATYPAAPNRKDADLSICLLHLYACPKGGSLFKQKIYSYEELTDLGYDVYVLGHYHLDQGIETINSYKSTQIIVNLGSVSRGCLVDDEINRIPRIGYIEVTVGGPSISFKCQSGRLKVKPAEEVFNIEQRNEEKKQKNEAEAFVAKLQTDLTVVSEEEDKIKSEVMALNIEKEVLDRVLGFLQEADLNKKSLET